MKTQKLAFLAGLALASLTSIVPAAKAAEKGDYQSWFHYYYKNPQPQDLVKATYQLNREGFFDGQTATAMGFYATVFAQNPDKVQGWFSEFNRMSPKIQRLMASALYLSGDSRGPQYLERAARFAPSDTRDTIVHLAQNPVQNVESIPVVSESSMNVAWGEFLADGKEAPVVKILAALGSGEDSISSAARWSLAVNGASHDRVLDICREQLDKQPREVNTVLKAVINDAQTKKTSS